jgi:hypothetical protein
MSITRGGNRAGGSPHVDANEIIKSARRRARAANSRRRGLLGDGEGVPVTDGQLALQTIAEPVEVEQPLSDLPPGRQRRTVPVRGTRKVAPPEPVTTARMPFVLSVLGLIAGGIIGLLVLNTAINENAFILQDLRENQTTLDAREQELTDELATLSAPGNLAAAAERLGLVEADNITYLRLPDGKELKMPKPGENQ